MKSFRSNSKDQPSFNEEKEREREKMASGFNVRLPLSRRKNGRTLRAQCIAKDEEEERNF